MKIHWKKKSTKTWSSRRSVRASSHQLRNQTIRQVSRPNLSSNSAPFQFTALALSKIRRLRSPSLLCRCCKRHRRNFIAQCIPVPEAGLTLIRLARPVPVINSRKLFTIPLRLQHHHLNWLIQQVHSNNRRYGHEFLCQKTSKKTKSFDNIGLLRVWRAFFV